MILSLGNFLPRRRYSLVKLGDILFFSLALCFLPQASSWACGIGPIPTLCSPPSALSKAGHPLSRTLTLSLSPAALLLGDEGGMGGRGSMAEASLPCGEGDCVLPLLGVDRRPPRQQASWTWSERKEKEPPPQGLKSRLEEKPLCVCQDAFYTPCRTQWLGRGLGTPT